MSIIQGDHLGINCGYKEVYVLMFFGVKMWK